MNRAFLLKGHVFKHWIESYLEHLADHFWEQSAHAFIQIGNLRVGVDLDEPDAEVFIDHKVEPEELKRVLSLARIKLITARHVTINSNVLHPGHEVLLYLQIILRILLIQVLLKLVETDNIALFVHAVGIFVFNL